MGYSDIIRVLSCGFILSAAALAGGLNASAREKSDVCKLLSSAEVEAVQGEPVKEAKAGAQPSGAMLMSQCVFHTSTSAKSVNVALATPRRAGDSGLAPREFWQRQFHSTEVRKKETRVAGKESAPERDEEGSKARPIGGLGEEAYWVGNPVAGALYVLQGDAFVRISVGGVREESARIEKSKALARAIMKRL